MMSNHRPHTITDPVAEFARVLRSYVELSGWNSNKIAKLVGVPASLVDDWLEGKEIPETQRWKRLAATVDHALFAYAPLRLEALRTLSERRRAEEMGANAKVGTSLADKLAPVIPLVAKPTPPKPAQRVASAVEMAMATSHDHDHMERFEEEKHDDQPESPVTSTPPASQEDHLAKIREAATAKLRSLPKGWRSVEQVNERKAWAKEYMLANPDASAGDVRAAVEAQFKCSVSYGTVALVKQEIEHEAKLAKRAARAATVEEAEPSTEPAQPEPTPEAVAAAINATPLSELAPTQPVNRGAVEQASINDQLQLAGQLILEAIPNLVKYTLAVDANGEVSVDYEVRKVVVETIGGKLTWGKKP